MKPSAVGATGGLVAVLSDASGFHREPGTSVLVEMLGAAALLRENTGLTACAELVTAADTDELIDVVRRIAADFPGGIYVAYTHPGRERALQAALSGTAAVITDQQTTAVALLAATLTTLRRRGVAPAAGRLVIVGSEHNPLVTELAVAAGIGEITRWGPADAHNLPLVALTGTRGTVVIDLNTAMHRRRHDLAIDSTAAVLAVDEPATALLALPALLAATRRTARPPAAAEHLACVHALIACTPPGQLLPTLADPALTGAALALAVAEADNAADGDSDGESWADGTHAPAAVTSSAPAQAFPSMAEGAVDGARRRPLGHAAERMVVAVREGGGDAE